MAKYLSRCSLRFSFTSSLASTSEVALASSAGLNWPEMIRRRMLSFFRSLRLKFNLNTFALYSFGTSSYMQWSSASTAMEKWRMISGVGKTRFASSRISSSPLAIAAVNLSTTKLRFGSSGIVRDSSLTLFNHSTPPTPEGSASPSAPAVTQ